MSFQQYSIFFTQIRLKLVQVTVKKSPDSQRVLSGLTLTNGKCGVLVFFVLNYQMEQQKSLFELVKFLFMQ